MEQIAVENELRLLKDLLKNLELTAQVSFNALDSVLEALGLLEKHLDDLLKTWISAA